MTSPRRVVFPPAEHRAAARELAAARARYFSVVVLFEASARNMRAGISNSLNNAQIGREAEARAVDAEARAAAYDRAVANATHAGLCPDLIRAIRAGATVL